MSLSYTSAGGLSLDDPNFWEKVLGEDVSAEALLVRAQGSAMAHEEQRAHLFEEAQVLIQGLLEKLTMQAIGGISAASSGETVEQEVDGARRLLLFLSANKANHCSKRELEKVTGLLAALDDAQNKRGRKRTCRAMDGVGVGENDDGGDASRAKKEEGEGGEGSSKAKDGDTGDKKKAASKSYPRFEVEDIYSRAEPALMPAHANADGSVQFAQEVEVVFERGDYVRCRRPPQQLNERSQAAVSAVGGGTAAAAGGASGADASADALAAAASASAGADGNGDGNGVSESEARDRESEVLGIVSQIYTWYETEDSPGELMVDIVMLYSHDKLPPPLPPAAAGADAGAGAAAADAAAAAWTNATAVSCAGGAKGTAAQRRKPLALPADPFAPTSAQAAHMPTPASGSSSRRPRKRARKAKGKGKKSKGGVDEEGADQREHDTYYAVSHHPKELLLCFDEVRLKAKDILYKCSCLFAEHALSPALMQVCQCLRAAACGCARLRAAACGCVRLRVRSHSVCPAAPDPFHPPSLCLLSVFPPSTFSPPTPLFGSARTGRRNTSCASCTTARATGTTASCTTSRTPTTRAR